jgi:nucleotide-binding universal stress UspA family protein
MAAPRYESILVGVDFSPTSKRALEHAASLAAGLGARLEVVHVFAPMRPTLPFSKPNRTLVNELNREARSDAKARLDAWVNDLPGQVNAHGSIAKGTPSDALLKRATAVKADIVVVGERGYNLAESLLIGSTAERVARKARRPVLLIPQRRR